MSTDRRASLRPSATKAAYARAILIRSGAPLTQKDIRRMCRMWKKDALFHIWLSRLQGELRALTQS